MGTLTAASVHLPWQLSPLISRHLPSVPPSTTWCARASLCPVTFSVHGGFSDFATIPQTRRYTQPNQVRFPADRPFAFGCSPPRLATTQLPSTSEFMTCSRADLHHADDAPSRAHGSRLRGNDEESRERCRVQPGLLRCARNDKSVIASAAKQSSRVRWPWKASLFHRR